MQLRCCLSLIPRLPGNHYDGVRTFERRILIVPSFGSPFSGFASEHKLTREELIRAVRFLVASEYEATQLYTQLADSIDHPFARAVLKDVADEGAIYETS